jgi:RNA polymerase sigma-70 factor (ECF subfamily)
MDGSVERDPRPDDAALVARCRAGDEEAFEALVRRYAPRCARLAGHFLGDAEEVADVVQESLASAFTHLGRYDASRRFWPWLARMVVNGSIDRLRSARARLERPSGALDARPADTHSPASAAAAAEERRRVREVLNSLPPRYRTVLVLREMEGMSGEEIARLLRRPAATIRWRLFKARRLFRDAWFDRRRGTE